MIYGGLAGLRAFSSISRTSRTPHYNMENEMIKTTLDDLHSQIMSLQFITTDNPTDAERASYRNGHRDARHAAAELVAAVSASDSHEEKEMNKQNRQKEPVVNLLIQHPDRPGIYFTGARAKCGYCESVLGSVGIEVDCAGWEVKEQEPKSNASSKRYSHRSYGTGHITARRTDDLLLVLLYLDAPYAGVARSFWVPMDELTEIPEVGSVSDSFEPEEAEHLNSIADSLGLPDLSEYKSKAQMLSNIYSKICENSSLVKKAALTLGFVSKN